MDQFTGLDRGLSRAEAAERLRRDGPNALPDPERRGFWRIVLEVAREPMFALLLAGGAVYLVIGEPRESLVLLAFASLSVAIAVIQGLRSERVLDALRDLSQPHVTVIRDGERQRITSAELVRGDVMALSEGERVPADGVLREGQEVEADESLLTGESLPVAKTTAEAPQPQPAPGGEHTPFVYSGSLIVRGQGLAEVAATGGGTEIGRIGHAIGRVSSPPTPLARETGRIVRVVGAAAIVVCAAVVLLYGLLRGSWLSGLLGGIALGMAMLPEEFPLVLNVFMVMGAWRISRAKVLTRRGSAIETLGSATVLCTDKTGTLTQNRMVVIRAWTPAGPLDWAAGAAVHEDARPLIEAGVLASAPHPFDPMERAFHDAAEPWLEAPDDWTLERRFGVAPGRLAVTHVWDDPRTGRRRAYVKGAVETVLGLCRVPESERPQILQAVDAMAEDGLRVLAIGAAETARDAPADDPAEIAFGFLGLVGLADPLRDDVRDAVDQCHRAGVRVVMITGDYPATARAIAAQSGIAAGEVMTGDDLRSLDEAELDRRIGAVTVFARILPEQKLRIVQALQGAGEVVAMTGDGVNDAPALKAADIGIAMGGRGTDVAREAAALVLLNDDFGSIVQAMRLGRRIYDNLQKAMSFILAVHVPIAGLALLPLLTGLPMLLAPAHIALLEMIIDPVCSVVFEAEAEEPDVMDRPPRRLGRSIFAGGRAWGSLAQGALVLVLVGGLFVWSEQAGYETSARTMSFLALALSFVLLAQANLQFGSGRRAGPRINRAFLAAVGALTAILTILFGWPLARDLLELAPLTAPEAALALAAAALAFAGMLAIGRMERMSSRGEVRRG
jgi:Ca2+-transporting ATPase